jgi:hypothetical protein
MDYRFVAFVAVSGTICFRFAHRVGAVAMIAPSKLAALVIAPLLFIGAPGKAAPNSSSNDHNRFRVAQNPPINDWNSGGVQAHPDSSGSSPSQQLMRAAPPAAMPPPMMNSGSSYQGAKNVYMPASPPKAMGDIKKAPEAATAPK